MCGARLWFKEKNAQIPSNGASEEFVQLRLHSDCSELQICIEQL